MKLPINFEQFVKEPVKAIMFLLICAVVYLYIDMKMTHGKQLDRCQRTEDKVEILTERLRKSDSTLAVAVGRLEIYKEVLK
jgi:uncharacterized membrane protein